MQITKKKEKHLFVYIGGEFLPKAARNVRARPMIRDDLIPATHLIHESPAPKPNFDNSNQDIVSNKGL